MSGRRRPAARFFALSRPAAGTTLGLAVLLGAFLAAAPAPAQPPAVAPTPDDPVAAFDAYVEAARIAWGVPGLAVALVDGGEIVLSKGYGVNALGEPIAVDENTLFAIGSTTKAMTAALVGELVAEKKLGWDDAVIDHLPGFRLHDPYVTREATVRDLLIHRAGLGNADLLWYGSDRSWEEIFAKLAAIEPAYSLRDGFVYQNLMYAAAGELAAHVAGTSWPELLERRIFTPLAMERSAPTLAGAAALGNVATPHDRVDGEIVPIANEPVDAVAPAGAVWSSAADMARWVRMLLAEGAAPGGGRVLAEATVEELLRPQTLVPAGTFYPTQQLTRPHWISYGLGWFQQDYRGHMVQFHTGSIDGMAAIVGLVPDAELGIVVLANLDHAEIRHALLWTAIDRFAAPHPAGGGEPERDWSAELLALYGDLRAAAQTAEEKAEAQRVPGTSPTLPLARYAGAYAHPLYDRVAVRHEDGALRLDAGPRFTAALAHWHYDSFVARWDMRWKGETVVSFVLDPRGEPAELRLFGETFERVRAESTGDGAATP